MANIVKIVGSRDYDFVNDQGVRYRGCKYYMLLHAGNPRVNGMEVAEMPASDTLMATWVTPDCVTPKIGEVAEVVYNRYGKLDHFRPLDLDSDQLSRLFDI